MLTCEYIVERIDGDYAMHRRTDDAVHNFIKERGYLLKML